MSTTLAPFTSSPGPTIRSLTIANLRSGEYKIVPRTAANGKDGSAGGGRRAGVTGVAAVDGALELERAGAISIGLAGKIGVGFAGATTGAVSGDVTRGDVGEGTGALVAGAIGVGFAGTTAGAATGDVTRAAAGAGTDARVTDGGNAAAGSVAGGFGATVAVIARLAVLPVPGDAGVVTELAGRVVAWGGFPAVTAEPVDCRDTGCETGGTAGGADSGCGTAKAGVSVRGTAFPRAGAERGGVARAIGSGALDCHHWL
jgi:hypothetical protein